MPWVRGGGTSIQEFRCKLLVLKNPSGVGFSFRCFQPCGPRYGVRRGSSSVWGLQRPMGPPGRVTILGPGRFHRAAYGVRRWGAVRGLLKYATLGRKTLVSLLGRFALSMVLGFPGRPCFLHWQLSPSEGNRTTFATARGPWTYTCCSVGKFELDAFAADVPDVICIG